MSNDESVILFSAICLRQYTFFKVDKSTPTSYNASYYMDKFFSVFGKIIPILLILSAMAYGGYYFGTQTKKITKPEAITTEDTSETADLSNSPINEEQLITISGGVAKSAGLSFDQYTLKASDEWKVTRENQTTMDEKLILVKGGYQISIFQAATGGALCLYEGDPDFEGPSSRFKTFKELTTQDDRTLRRSGEENATAFTVCQKYSDGSFGQPTNYGHISIKLPNNWDENDLEEIDSILASLKKV